MAEHTNEEQWLEDGLRIGSWWVEPQLNRISENGETVRLEPKVMHVLVCLARRPAKTVTKDQFMDQVWSDTVVTSDALLRCISELRKTLGDDARDPEYIETIRGAGYRLIAPVDYAPEARPGSVSGDASAAALAPPWRNVSLGEPPAADVPPARLAEAEHPGGEEVQAEAEGRAEAAAETAEKPARGTGGAPEEAAPDRTVEEAAPDSPFPVRWRLLRVLLRSRQSQGLRRSGWLVALLLIVATAFWTYQATTKAPPAVSEPVPFTSFPGEEFDPDISPDGQQVAFVWDGGDGENFDIYIKQAGTDAPLRITQGPAREGSPAWSPEGSHLAFVRQEDGTHRVIITPAVGNGEREVANFGPREVQGLVWSPDGSTLAMAAQEAPYEAYNIVLLSVESLEKRRLTQPPSYYHGDLDPAFSPDGKHLAFMRSVVDRVQDLYIVPVEGGQPQRLTYDRAAVTGLDWTANGRSIVFASDRDGTSKLWRVAEAGGEPTWIATVGGGGELQQPSIAREGERMMVTERSFDTNIWHLRRTSGYGGLSSHRLIFSTRWDSNPDISPDGERIAFASKRSGSFEIWTSLRDGTEPVQLTNFGGPFTSMPRWSPDSSRIAFVSQEDESASIYIVDAAGGEARRLSKGTFNDVAPSWSRDGRWVYFGSNRSGDWQIWKMPVEGGAAQQVTQHGGFAAFESADREDLYYVKKNTPGIWKQPLEGGASERVVDGFEPYDWGNWVVMDDGIYYVRRSADEPPLLAFRSFSSDRTLRVAYLHNLPQHPSLAVAPGGEWFLHAKIDRSESDLLLVENFR